MLDWPHFLSNTGVKVYIIFNILNEAFCHLIVILSFSSILLPKLRLFEFVFFHVDLIA